MKLVIKSWGRPNGIEREASAHFTPPSSYDEGGIAEVASSRSREACEAMGRLLAVMLEKRILTADECSVIAGVNPDDIIAEVL